MSGIAGIIRFDGAPVKKQHIEAMTDAMSHRGPDGITHLVTGSVGLGQCMMRTTPESIEERQPLANEDQSLILVMDGRVDNWQELREELLTHRVHLRDRSDAELVLKAYQLWGKDCLDNIDGDFAFVIWQTKERTAFCARDRVGNKPFYYHWDGQIFTFASELSAVLDRPWIKQELNEGILAEYLAAEWYSLDETLWCNVMRLMPAHRMEIAEQQLNCDLYWQPDCFENLPFSKEEDFVYHYRSLITDIVKRMSRSHQVVACEVSGGLDSSAIFAVAEHLRQQQQLLAPEVDGYTLDFSDDADANELVYSRSVGDFLGKEIEEIPPSKMALSWFQKRAEIDQDFVSYPTGTMGLGIRDAAREKHSRVLLVGVGGDEWLGGDRSYYAEAIAAGQWREFIKYFRFDRNELGLRKSLWLAFRYGIVLLLPTGLRRLLGSIVAIYRKHKFGRLDWLTPKLESLLQKRRDKFNRIPTPQTRRVGQRELAQMMAGNAYSLLAREREERLAAQAGLELRRPFFDPRIIQFAYSTPTQFRFKGQYNRCIHRQAMRELLPEIVLQRLSKANFMVSFQWQLPEMEKMLDKQLSEFTEPWVDSSKVRQLFGMVKKEKHGGWPELMLWTLFECFSLQRNA